MGWRVSWYKADKENPVVVEEIDEGDGVLYTTGKINGKAVMHNQGTDIWIELKCNEDFKKEIKCLAENPDQDFYSITKEGFKMVILAYRDRIIENLKKNNLVLFGTYQWDVSKKNIIHDKVANIFPQIEWLYDKNGELKKENFDASDSYVAALGYLNKEKYGEIEFNVSDIQEKDTSCLFTLSYWNKVEKREIHFV